MIGPKENETKKKKNEEKINVTIIQENPLLSEIKEMAKNQPKGVSFAIISE